MSYRDADLEALDKILADRGQIAIVWRVADVLEIRPDLTHSQAWHVLQEIKADHHAGIGVNWSTLSYVAEELFGVGPLESAA